MAMVTVMDNRPGSSDQQLHRDSPYMTQIKAPRSLSGGDYFILS